MDLLNSIIENTSFSPRIISTNNDLNSINWVSGMSDPGEMIACGAYQELRRLNGESDTEYQERITALLQNLPSDVREKIMTAGRKAAIKRASLDTSNGKINLMVAGKLPWHGLGVNVSEATTSRQAIQLAGMNWTVKKVPCMYDTPNGWKESKQTFSIVRQDTCEELGSTGSRYKPIQNIEGFDFLDGILDEFGARYEAAGSLYNGEKVFMLVHLPKQAFHVSKQDKIDAYVAFTNCHDGTGAAFCHPTSVRMVCANTFRVGGADRHKGLTIRHTGDLKAKMASAKQALGMAVEGFSEFKEAAEVMKTKPMEINHYASDVLDAVLDITQAQVNMGADVLAAAITKTIAERELAEKSFARKIEKRENILEEILNAYEDKTNSTDGMRGTAWAAFNSVTYVADHSKMGKESKDLELRKSRRFESVISGEMDELKQTAYQLATAV